MIAESLALLARKPELGSLNEQIDRIAESGSIISASHHFVGITDICAPILDKSGRGIASLVMPCLQKIGFEREFDTIRDRLVATCREISNALL